MNRFTDVVSSQGRPPYIDGYVECPLHSLSEAIQPLYWHVKHLDHNLKIAEKKCHFPSKHGLTRDESAAIYLYTMENGDDSLYKVLNSVLRSKDRRKMKSWLPYLKLFDVGVQKLPDVYQDVWRGIQKDIRAQYKKNDIITWWGISSCSTSVDILERFLKPPATLFLIEGIHGKDISRYTSVPAEQEVLLRPGVQLHVTSNTFNRSSFSLVHLRGVVEQNQTWSSTPVPAALQDTIFSTVKVLSDEDGNRYHQSIQILHI